jgi:hypothetical protein
VLGRLGSMFGLRRAAAVAAPEAKPDVEAQGGPHLAAPPAPGTASADRARVADAAPLPPALAPHAGDGLVALIAALRGGRPAIAPGERQAWTDTLRGYRPDALHALREALVNRPPHPDLKAARGHPALKGRATPEGVAAILTGEVFGWPPRAPRPHPERLAETLRLLTPLVPAEVLARWQPALEASGPLTNLAGYVGPAAFTLVEAFGLPLVERLDGEWSARQLLTDVAHRLPHHLPGLQAAHRRLGDAGLVAALEALDEGCSAARLSPAALLEQGGAEAALAAGAALHADRHATRALRVEVGPAGVLALAGGDLEVLQARLQRAGRAVAAFGAGEAPLYRGARWPEHPPPTPALAQAEARVKAACDLPGGVDLGAPELPPAALGRLTRHLQADLQARAPAAAQALERELLGRRFIAPRYYDELYAQGVQNPEHRYSVATFESWRGAAALARAEGERTRGRPLAPGELTQVLQRLHAAAGAGMVEIHESHLRAPDLGRLRSRAEDHVQLGDLLHDVDPELARLLDRNPYLAKDPAFEGEGGKLRRLIRFAPGPEVPGMVAALDAWVRSQEAAGLDPRALAAEVHHRLVSIHPFMDGNGRTSKLAVDFLMARAGAPEPLWRESEVLRHVERWPEAADAGMRFHLDVVLRHWRAAQAGGAR